MPSSIIKAATAHSFTRLEWREAGPAAPARRPESGADPAARASLEKQAYDRGFRDGEAAGARKASEQVQAAVESFSRSAASLAGYKTALGTAAERELLDLSLAVARKILRRELSVDPNVVLAVVRSCLEELRQIDIYRLHVHPQDAAAVAAWFQQHRHSNVEVLPDPQITRGGVLFETARGRLDARLEAQIQEIELGLADH
jgi:flagellar assembly protein FliH